MRHRRIKALAACGRRSNHAGSSCHDVDAAISLFPPAEGLPALAAATATTAVDTAAAAAAAAAAGQHARKTRAGVFARVLAVNQGRLQSVQLPPEGSGLDLHSAAAAGDERAVAALLRRLGVGRELDRRDSAGATPLLLAANGGHLGTAEALAQAGADADAADAAGWSPLHAAAERQDERMVLLLLNAGADPSARDRQGRTALHVAAASASARPGSECAALLCLTRRSPHQLGWRAACGATPLHTICGRLADHAARQAALCALQAVARTRLLIPQHLEAADCQGRSPLALAAAAGSGPAVRLLVSCGASAASGSCPPCCTARRRLQQQIPADIAGSTGGSSGGAAGAKAVGDGLGWGSLEALRCTTSTHTCALGAAACRRDCACVHALLAAGASAAGFSSHLLGWAVTEGRADVAAALLAAGQRCAPATALLAAVDRGDRAMLCMLLGSGLDPNCPEDAEGAWRLLQAALQPGREQLLRLLLGQPRPAAPGCRCLDAPALAQRLQRSPVLHAVRYASVEALQALLAAGCPVGAVPAGAALPPLVAAASRLDLPRCRVLLEAGAPAAGADQRGRSALDTVLSLCTDARLVELAAEETQGAAAATERELLQLVELLLGAGTPCSQFLSEEAVVRGHAGGGSASDPVAAPRQPPLLHGSLMLALGLPAWSPAEHALWPLAFKRAAAAFLLVARGQGLPAHHAASACCTSRWVSGRGRLHLPPEICQLVLAQAARQLSCWVAAA